MTTTATLTCLAPTLRYGSDADAIVANTHRLQTAIRALPKTSERIVLLPLGCLSGTAGVADAGAAAAAFDALQQLASELGCYIAGAEQVVDDPVRGFIFAPVPAQTIWQASISQGTGPAKVSVLETPFGKLACLPTEDLLHPEYARSAIFGGAEILLNPSREYVDERSMARHMSRAARAWENIAFVASCSLGEALADDNSPHPGFGGRATAEIWHHSGHLLVDAGSTPASAALDVIGLRARRAEPWVNFPAQLRTGIYATEYASAARNIGAASSADTDATVVSSEESPESYEVLMMQAHQSFVSSPETRDATIADNLKRALGMARMFAMRPSTRLVVFPEFFLQGSDGSHPHEYWERCGIRIPGPETEQLAAFAKACNVYVCGAVLEYDPSWPRRYFNTSIIIAPSGEIALRYRKLQCADLNGLLNITTPGNIHSEYIERYGVQSLIPVIDTPIGRLGTLICFDANWPELWRALAMKGAEVICNPTSEIHSNRRPYWYQAKRAQAAQNLLYVASANAGSEQFFPGAPITGMNRGHSALIDYNGELVACADGPGIIPLVGRIELGTLRRARARLAADPAVRFRPDAVVGNYANFPGFPLDCFLTTPMEQASEGPRLVAEQIARLQSLGVLTAPR